MTEVDRLGPGEVGFLTALDQGGGRHPRRRHHHRGRAARPRRRCPASSRCSRWCSAGSSRSTPPSSRICAPRWAGCASTTRASPTRWRPPPRSASASAAASWASCTSRSSRSACEREFNLDLIATAPSVVYKIHLHDGAAMRAAQPGRHAGPDEDRHHRGALDPRHHPHAGRVSRRQSSSSARTGAASRSTSTMSAAAPWWSTTCR